MMMTSKRRDELLIRVDNVPRAGTQETRDPSGRCSGAPSGRGSAVAPHRRACYDADVATRTRTRNTAKKTAKAAADARIITAPQLSIIIPVYNEEAILEEAVRRLVDEVRAVGCSFELILSANGCRDGTVPLAELLMGDVPELVLLRTDEPNYGRALRLGIEAARGRIVICDEIDLCDVGFYRRALRRLEHDECDMVVGSKAMPGARDRRPVIRRAATRVINGMLWATLGFQGTDTHGLKAFLRAPVLPILHRCVVDKDLFASELVIRCGRAGLRIQEIPIELEEQRSSPIHLVKRIPRVLKDLSRLVVAIRLRSRTPTPSNDDTSRDETP